MIDLTKRVTLSRSEWTALIDEWVLNERYRLILKRRMLDGVSFERLAEEVDMSTRQVQQIVSDCQTHILNVLKSRICFDA
jgi:DNA-directed RNA polymerase specialized sigma subunit